MTFQAAAVPAGFRVRTITTPEASTRQWVILVTLEAESSEVTTGAIFLGGTAQEIKRCKKPGLPERVRTNTQAVLRLAWGGLAKGNQSVQQAVEKAIYRAWGPGFRGLGPGLGAGASRNLRPGFQASRGLPYCF